MISGRFSVWQKVVALAPLLLLAAYLPGQMMLRCRIDGHLRPVCCCPHDDEKQDTGPVVKAQDCCDRELTVTQRPVFEAEQRAADQELGPLSVVTVLPVAAPLAEPNRSGLMTWQAHGPPGEGPPIVLLKHAFLI
jgi:hypothetical protein